MNQTAPNFNTLRRQVTRILSINFTKIGREIRPCGAKKFATLEIYGQIFVFFEPEIPKYPRSNVKFGMAEGTFRSAKFHVNPRIVSPLRAEKPQNWTPE